MAEVLATLRAKNADYAGGRDPFINFRASEMLGVPALRGILVRMLDKINRASTLIDADPAVAGESLEDAFRDLNGYSAIALALLREEARRSEPLA